MICFALPVHVMFASKEHLSVGHPERASQDPLWSRMESKGIAVEVIISRMQPIGSIRVLMNESTSSMLGYQVNGSWKADAAGDGRPHPQRPCLAG
jgi:hypothetical protein